MANSANYMRAYRIYTGQNKTIPLQPEELNDLLEQVWDDGLVATRKTMNPYSRSNYSERGIRSRVADFLRKRYPSKLG